MASRDNFGSNMKSPGGWGGTGGGSSVGGMGSQKASQYNYNQMGPGKIGNFNTGGARVGTGNQFGVNRDTGAGPWPGGYATPVLKQPVLSPVPPVAVPPTTNPVVAALARRPAVTVPEGAPQGEQIPEGISPGLNNPFVRGFPANPGGQFGPRTYNDGYQTVRADKFQNNPAYGSPGGGLGQYNNQTTVNQNNQGMGGLGGGAGRGGGWNTNAGKYGGPR